MARKAARGAGYDWALADEAGWACVTLCEAGIDGVGALAGLLEAGGAEFAGDLDVSGAVWRRGSGHVCPVYAGAVVCDRTALAGGSLVIEDVLSPLVLLPYLRAATRGTEGAIAVTAGQGHAMIDTATIDVRMAFPDGPARVEIALTDISPRVSKSATRATPDPAAWGTLTTYAHRTYAPATEASRLKGAGGDLPDTD